MANGPRALVRLLAGVVLLFICVFSVQAQDGSTSDARNPLQPRKRITNADRAAAAARRITAAEKLAKAPRKQTAGQTRRMPGAPVQGGQPDYFGPYSNWANSPRLQKFVDPLPLLAAPDAAGNWPDGEYLPVGVPDTKTYPGSDYYEIELIEYQQQMHRDLPPTRLRGYRQTNNGTGATGENTIAPPVRAHYLGPVIVAQRNRPVRIKFTNRLPTGTAGKLFLPVDTSIMGSGPGPLDWSGEEDPVATCRNPMKSCYTENRANLHLHGGKTPWISDGTPHQFITPAGENTPYKKGVSLANVPDMPDPGEGATTYYYSNQQSARLMFYHDHAWGITRLNVYAGEAAGYLIEDDAEKYLVDSGAIPAEQIPLIIQDKSFVNAVPDTVTASVDAGAMPVPQILETDPTWNWGTGAAVNGIRPPVHGDLWWPHVYVPAQNPFDITGVNPWGRWAYGPWFWPPTNVKFMPVANPWYDPACDPDVAGYCQPPEMPAAPNPSWGAEAFMDTAVVNGMAYPKLQLQPKPYRFRILNAAHDRFWNLQLYVADPQHPTEVKMVPAAAPSCNCTPNGATFPPRWPTDNRDGGVPDPGLRGPDWIQIGTEGGFLPKPAVVPQQPVGWNNDPTTFNAGNVIDYSLLLGPAERADVIVDLSQFGGKTLILYNDAPAAFPALDARLDYYTNAPDLRDTGGLGSVIEGYGPNTRTLMAIEVAPGTGPGFNLANLESKFANTGNGQSLFERWQDPIIVGQKAYNDVYSGNLKFPNTWPYWGISRIQDNTLGFETVKNQQMFLNMQPKAIQDEMGETYDEYGRMSAKLGLEMAFTNAANQTFVLQNFVDPATEIVKNNLSAEDDVNATGTQIWKITHNGVDTHPVHFHIFDVQVINRVGWDGAIRPPDANELGWKDTVRISPLEDTIVALRPVGPKLPFGIPDSVRPMNPAVPLNSAAGFTQVNPFTGQGRSIVNANVNFLWEYVWHCHILSHEEADMMRPISLEVATNVPDPPLLSLSTTTAGLLEWTDGTPVGPDPANPLNLGDPKNEIGFRIERADVGAGGAVGQYSVLAAGLANQTSYLDTTAVQGSGYNYRVVAWSSSGETVSNVVTTALPPPLPPSNVAAKMLTATTVELSWADNSSDETSFRIERATDAAFTLGVMEFGAAANTTTTVVTVPDLAPGVPYYFRMYALRNAATSVASNVASVTRPVDALGAPSNLTAGVGTGPRVNLSWADNSTTESGFRIERATNNAFTGTLTTFNVGADVKTYSDTAVQADNTYYYRVIAVNATLSTASAPSNTATAGPPAVPTNLVVTQADGDTPVVITFSDNANNEVSFTLRRSADDGVNWLAKATLPARTGTGLTVTFNDPRSSFTPGQVLRYRVRANNALGSSPWLTMPSPGITVH